MSQSTQPAEDTPGLPIRSLSVEVVDGEAKGARAEGAAESLSVGSAEGNDLVIADPTVSRYHLELRRGEEGVRVIDHGSTNGTRYEGARIERGTVPPGARLSLGHTLSLIHI